MAAAPPAGDLRAEVASIPLWYHVLDLPGGVTTPGAFDLRGLVDKLPWPDVRGKRCLDVGTYDGFLAWELERRGAREVVAVDIPDPADWDWPAAVRARGGEALARAAGGDKGAGFHVAHRALGSQVKRHEGSVYHLSREALGGGFDVVVCGSLLLHLRDPVRALEAIRSVCDGHFLSTEEISLPLTVLHRRRAVAEVRASEELCQWWVVNAMGHRRLVQTAGFEIEQTTRPYLEPFGPGHGARPGGIRARALQAFNRAATGQPEGVPHAALLARPRLQAPPVPV